MVSRTATSTARQLIALFTLAFCCASVEAAEPPDGWRMVFSWSPLYCSANLSSKEPQCTEEHYFVNHGLVPFRRSGPAEKDDSCAEWDMSEADSDRWLWVIPNKARVRALWRKHGSCSGLDTVQYLAAVDRASRRVQIPERYKQVTERLDTTASAVRQAFVEANPGLTADSVDLICKGSRLSEVNICFDADFGFRSCEATKECGENLRLVPIRASRVGVEPYH